MANELFDHVIAAYPRIRERRLESRVIAVLNEAYAFRFEHDIDALVRIEADSAQDACEVLQVAAELASTVTGFAAVERPSGIRAVLSSLRPPPMNEGEK